MKKDIHPEYQVATVKCVCGNEFQTRSTLKEINVEICSACHPFFTGQQKLIDSAGRVERFMRKYGKEYAVEEAPAEKRAASEPASEPKADGPTAEPAKGAAAEPRPSTPSGGPKDAAEGDAKPSE